MALDPFPVARMFRFVEPIALVRSGRAVDVPRFVKVPAEPTPSISREPCSKRSPVQQRRIASCKAALMSSHSILGSQGVASSEALAGQPGLGNSCVLDYPDILLSMPCCPAILHHSTAQFYGA